jgi:hypothetical protein
VAVIVIAGCILFGFLALTEPAHAQGKGPTQEWNVLLTYGQDYDTGLMQISASVLYQGELIPCSKCGRLVRKKLTDGNFSYKVKRARHERIVEASFGYDAPDGTIFGRPWDGRGSLLQFMTNTDGASGMPENTQMELSYISVSMYMKNPPGKEVPCDRGGCAKRRGLPAN